MNRRNLLLGLSSLLITPYAFADEDRRADCIIDSYGSILLDYKMNEPRHPASLTKLMTLYILFQRIKNGSITLSDQFDYGRNAAMQPPMKLALRPRSKIKVENCIYSLIVISANDVATCVAENLANSESRFTQVMGQTAYDLGMYDTNFTNASGLPNQYQISTAYDLCLLSWALIRDFPEFYPYFNMKYFRYGKKRYLTHNKLVVDHEIVDGLKTGFTNASGYNLASSTKKENREVAVTLGHSSAISRNQHMARLLKI